MKMIPKAKERELIEFDNLEPGDTFRWRGAVWIKGNIINRPTIMNLDSGDVYTGDGYGEFVVPVNVIVVWEYPERTGHIIIKKKD